MDSRRPVTIELEKTNEGYIVATTHGVPQRPRPRAPAPESTRIQISLAPQQPLTFPPETKRIEPEPLPQSMAPAQVPQLRHTGKQGYEVFPHVPATSQPASETKKEDRPTIVLEEKPNGAAQMSLSEIRRYPLVLPSCASWFDLETIHEIEERALPEFFCGKYPSKTPQVYKEYRNFIVKLYRANPNSYLSATTCRRHLAGDVCSIIRIHAFLEHWGLINFSVDPYVKPHKFVQLDTKPQSAVRQEQAAADPSAAAAINLATKEKRPGCDFCGELCGFVWFVHMAGARTAGKSEPEYNITLCEQCLENGNFPRVLTKGDFDIRSIKTEFAALEPAGDWTNEETLALLSAVEKHQGEWSKVAEELRGKGRPRTARECTAKFMSLPVSESLSSRLTSPGGDAGAAEGQNPVLMQMGLFAKELERYSSEEPKGKIKEKRRDKKLVRKEKEEIRRLIGLIVEAQMKKLECKMEFFNEFDSLLQNERQQIKALQSQLFAERINLSMNKSDLGQSGRRHSFDGARKNSVTSDPTKVMSPSKPPMPTPPSMVPAIVPATVPAPAVEPQMTTPAATGGERPKA